VFRHLSTAFDIFGFGYFRASFLSNPKWFSHRNTHVEFARGEAGQSHKPLSQPTLLLEFLFSYIG